MFQLEFEPIVEQCAPGLQVLQIEADIVNESTPDALWDEIARLAATHAGSDISLVNKRPAIAATRLAYKAFGKEPNRYRPSAEALLRRMVKGLELYRSQAVIDLINLLSAATGHSIGGFDADKISGERIVLGVGREGEPYQAIGRGELNIEGLPVWRDALGGIGTPTSDNDRTKLSPESRRLLMIVNMYGPDADDPAATEQMARRLLADYASAENIVSRLIHV